MSANEVLPETQGRRRPWSRWFDGDKGHSPANDTVSSVPVAEARSARQAPNATVHPELMTIFRNADEAGISLYRVGRALNLSHIDLQAIDDQIARDREA